MSSASWPVKRELRSLSAALEKRVLIWLAKRVPAGVGPDHMTALGLLGYAAGGIGYALSRAEPAWLLVVNLALVVNWLGDSLDGTLARVRRRERPRYGFYVDHMVDGLGVLLMLGGLGLSGQIAPGLAVALLAAYELLSLHLALATCATGTFTMALAGLGGTELRLLLAGANLLAYLLPVWRVAGLALRPLDVLGAFALLGLAVGLAAAVVGTARRLDRAERLPAA